MATPVQQTYSQEQERPSFWQQPAFLESAWISAFTKWLLTFGGKAARLTLIICTLYMSAELYPGVSFPAGLNLAMFIILSFALDMGGLGLAQIAKSARAIGKEQEAVAGETLARWLIGVMIAGLITISLQNAGNMMKWTPEWKNYVAIFWMVVEISLSVARCILAVQYGHVLHALEHSIEQVQEHDDAEQEALQGEVTRLQRELQTANRTATDAQSRLQSDLRASQKSLADAMAQLSQLQESLRESLSCGTSMQLSLAEMEASMKAKMELSIDTVKAQMKAEMQAAQTRLQEEIQALKNERATLKAQLKEQKSVPVKPVPRPTPAKVDARKFVNTCLDNNAQLKLAELAELVRKQGLEVSEPTLSRYRKEWRQEHGESDFESSAI